MVSVSTSKHAAPFCAQRMTSCAQISAHGWHRPRTTCIRERKARKRIVGAQPKLYWHFAAVDGEGTPRLGYGDGREVRVGETLRVEGTPVPCEHGLHASETLWDALGCARGDR